MKTFFAIFFTIFALSNATNLPENLKTCRRSDPAYSKCLDTVVAAFIKSLGVGLKSFKILPIEPLSVDSVQIGESSGPVAVKQEYHNIKIHGLTNGLVIKNYNVDFDKLIIQSEAFNPQVDFVADYELDGQVLVLPIRGKGRSNITMIDLHSVSQIICETEVRDGETYLKVKKYNIKFNPEKVVMKFDNLFDGNNALGEQMNMFINENSELLFKELQSSYEVTFGLVFANVANNVFSRIPMKILFPA